MRDTEAQIAPGGAVQMQPVITYLTTRHINLVILWDKINGNHWTLTSRNLSAFFLF